MYWLSFKLELGYSVGSRTIFFENSIQQSFLLTPSNKGEHKKQFSLTTQTGTDFVYKENSTLELFLERFK